MDPETTQPGTEQERFLTEASVEMQPGVFPLGCSVRLVGADMRLRDRLRRLNLAGLLDSTPYHWVWLDGYRIGRGMVTNGQYKQFLLDEAFDDEGCWRHVWETQGRRIESHPRYDQDADGKPFRLNEVHSGARNFVEAFIDSLEKEVQQWAEFDAMPPSNPSGDPPSVDGSEELDIVTRSKIVSRLFCFVKSCLADAIVGVSDDEVLSPKDQLKIEVYFEPGGRQQLERDVAVVRSFTVKRLSLLVPPIQRDKLKRAPQEMVEAIAILDRLKKEWTRGGQERRVPLRRVFYPRAWATPDGERPSAGKFRTPSVPWEDRPVFGVTLYEAAAYCAWMSACTNWRLDVDLPSEAQYERAASWPNEPTLAAEGKCDLDPRAKLLFPWQDHCSKDFNDLFGQEQRTLQRVYADPAKYRKLVNESARKLDADEQIEQLLGFGWQWCTERFDNGERRYSRFVNDEYDQHGALVVNDAVSGIPAPVYVYAPNTAVQHSHFVVRGAPEVLGGPGLTTRRFAMYPLRSYPNVGFRWVCRPGLSDEGEG